MNRPVASKIAVECRMRSISCSELNQTYERAWAAADATGLNPDRCHLAALDAVRERLIQELFELLH